MPQSPLFFYGKVNKCSQYIKMWRQGKKKKGVVTYILVKILFKAFSEGA